MPRLYGMFLFKVRTIVSKRIKDKFDIIRVPRLDFVMIVHLFQANIVKFGEKSSKYTNQIKIAGRNRIFSRWEFSENLLKLNLTWELKFTNFSLG